MLGMPGSQNLAHLLDSVHQAHRWYVYCRRLSKRHILKVTGSSIVETYDAGPALAQPFLM